MGLTQMTRVTLAALAMISAGTAAALIWLLFVDPLTLLVFVW